MEMAVIIVWSIAALVALGGVGYVLRALARSLPDPYAVMQAPPDMSAMRYDFAKAQQARAHADARDVQRRKLAAAVSSTRTSAAKVVRMKTGAK